MFQEKNLFCFSLLTHTHTLSTRSQRAVRRDRRRGAVARGRPSRAHQRRAVRRAARRARYSRRRHHAPHRQLQDNDIDSVNIIDDDDDDDERCKFGVASSVVVDRRLAVAARVAVLSRQIERQRDRFLFGRCTRVDSLALVDSVVIVVIIVIIVTTDTYRIAIGIGEHARAVGALGQRMSRAGAQRLADIGAVGSTCCRLCRWKAIRNTHTHTHNHFNYVNIS